MQLFVGSLVLGDMDGYTLLAATRDEGVDLTGIAEAEQAVGRAGEEAYGVALELGECLGFGSGASEVAFVDIHRATIALAEEVEGLTCGGVDGIAVFAIVAGDEAVGLLVEVVLEEVA